MVGDFELLWAFNIAQSLFFTKDVKFNRARAEGAPLDLYIDYHGHQIEGLIRWNDQGFLAAGFTRTSRELQILVSCNDLLLTERVGREEGWAERRLQDLVGLSYLNTLKGRTPEIKCAFSSQS